jgi:hypothetical protein
MSDITPPDWVLREAAERSELSNDTPRQRAILFDTNPSFRALCRAIEQHEAFKQEVSDAVEAYLNPNNRIYSHSLNRFIIPKPKPDPLVEAMRHLDWSDKYADPIRAALDALGFEIREKGQ